MKLLVMALFAASVVGAPPEPAEQRGTPSQSAPTGQTVPMPLVGTDWTLAALGDLIPADHPSAREPHLIFYPDGTVTGSDGCNSLRASVTAGDDWLKFGALMGTLMTCSLPDKIDRRLREALVITRSWKISSGALTLFDAKGVAVARFDPRPIR